MSARKQSRSLRIFLALLFAVSVAGNLLAGTAPPQAASSRQLTISAAVSLKDALDQVAEAYHAQKPAVVLHFNLGGSGTLQRQIEQGAPVDLFISASPKEMDGLQSKDLLMPGTRKDLLKNRIVLIIPVGDSRVKIESFQDLAKPDVKLIAVGEPKTVPAGEYAQEVLTHLRLYDQLKSKFVLGRDVRQVLTYVATKNVDAGIVYVTDALSSQEVKIVATAPEDSHSAVTYPVAILKGSKDMAAARDFEGFLLGSQARAIFQKFGFAPATP